MKPCCVREDQSLSGKGKYVYWQSKIDGHTKHGFLKKAKNNTSAVYDCYLSRVLNKADEISGFPKVQRTPKTKIVNYDKWSSASYLLSRVQGLEGKPPEKTVSGHSLHAYSQHRRQSCPLMGVMNALIDAVLVQRWDMKPDNLSAPHVRNFDMDFALCISKKHQKPWAYEEFLALVRGKTIGEDKISSGKSRINRIAHAFVQTICGYGSRVNKYYGDQTWFPHIDHMISKRLIPAIKKDIRAERQGNESPSMTVLRMFSMRISLIRQAVSVDHKNPCVEVQAEIKRSSLASIKYLRRVEYAEHDLEEALKKFQGYIEQALEELHHKEQSRSMSYAARMKNSDEAFVNSIVTPHQRAYVAENVRDELQGAKNQITNR